MGKAADEHAGTFDCKRPPRVTGKPGRAIELAKR